MSYQHILVDDFTLDQNQHLVSSFITKLQYLLISYVPDFINLKSEFGDL